MFQWLKKLVGAAEETPSALEPSVFEPDRSVTETLKLVTVWDVVDSFLTNNPTPTPYTVHALIDAGAADLLDPGELLQVCEKIQEHGYQYPLNGVLLAELKQSELIQFLRWQSKSAVDKESYDNEPRILELIERYRIDG